MKHRFLIHLALLLLAAMLLPMPVMAEDLMSVTAAEPAEEVFSTEEAPVPEELPEFQLVAPDVEETDNKDAGVEAAVMAATASDDADATVDVPKAATPTKLTLGVKETYTLKVSGAKKYKSSDKTIAKVSSKGVITAKKVGKATITVTDKKGKKTKIKVTVKKAPKKVTLNKTKKTLEVGKTYQLKAKLPSKTASHKLTWKSDNPKVAKVDSNGKVTALKAGKAKITVKTFNKRKATCKVTVNGVTEPEDDHRSYELREYLGKSLDSLNNNIPDKLQNLRNKYFSVKVEDGIITGINLQHEIPLVEGGAKYQLFLLSPGMEYNDSNTRFIRFALWKVLYANERGVVQLYILDNDSFPSYRLQIMVINDIVRQVYMYKYE